MTWETGKTYEYVVNSIRTFNRGLEQFKRLRALKVDIQAISGEGTVKEE